jgi:hypothetical protein
MPCIIILLLRASPDHDTMPQCILVLYPGCSADAHGSRQLQHAPSRGRAYTPASLEIIYTYRLLSHAFQAGAVEFSRRRGWWDGG